MIKIIPAILPQTFRGIEASVEKIQGVVDTVQLDFVDGHFASNRTWWFNNKDEERLQALLSEAEGMPFWETMNYELDLMVKDPLEQMDTFIMLGPSKIIFHVECFLEKEQQETLLDYFEKLPGIIRETISFGLALDINTEYELIRPYLDYITTVQCMGIQKIGFQGQTFDVRVLDKIQKVKELYPDKIIAVDGGVTMENAPDIITAGATDLIVGSQIFASQSPADAIHQFKRVVKNI